MSLPLMKVRAALRSEICELQRLLEIEPDNHEAQEELKTKAAAYAATYEETQRRER